MVGNIFVTVALLLIYWPTVWLIVHDLRERYEWRRSLREAIAELDAREARN